MGAWFRWIKKLYEYLYEKLEGVKAGIPGVGNTYFVDAVSGLDTNTGLTRDKALKTITAALGKCVSGHEDYVAVIDYFYGTDVEASFPIVISKDNVHIIGLGALGICGQRCYIDGGGEDVFQLAANVGNVEIAGFSLLSTGAAGISLAGAAKFIHVHHMTFGDMGVLQDGIMVGGELAEHGSCELAFSTIEECFFSKALSRDGVRTGHEYGTLSWVFIRDCIFRKYAGIGINFQQHNPAARGGGFFNNKFFQKIGGDKGCAITIGGGAVGEAAQMTMVDGNHAMEDGEDPGNNPYFDTSTNSLATLKNAWGLNYKGTAATYPACFT